MNFGDVIEWNIPEGPLEEVRETATGRIIWQSCISVIYHDFIPYNNIYFFNDNPNLIRTDYIPSDSSVHFSVLRTSNNDFLCHEKQDHLRYVEYPQNQDYTVLSSPEQINLPIPEGCQFVKWIDANDSKEYNIGDRIQNNGYDRILYMKFEEYDNLIDDQKNDIVDNNYLDIEISK